MKHVLWIGGPPCAGKTTIATRLARRHGLRLYSADTRTWEHRDRAIGEGNPAARRWESLTPAERWERSTPDEMLEMSLYRERGPMVVDDLGRLPESPLIIAEGVPLPTSLIADGIAPPSQVVWLIPTVEFQDSRLAAVGTTRGHAVLYQLMRDLIEREAREHHLPTLTVDGSRGLSEMVAVVEQLFADPLAEGPCATTLEDHRALLRDANLAIVTQIRDHGARPWADGDPDEVTRPFTCECGDPRCDADVVLTVREVSARAAIAPGHPA
jgi:hypothetical protein